MKSPTSSKSSLKYAAYLGEIHGKKFFPIRRATPIKNKLAINFAAVEADELAEYISNGWQVVIEGKAIA